MQHVQVPLKVNNYIPADEQGMNENYAKYRLYLLEHLREGSGGEGGDAAADASLAAGKAHAFGHFASSQQEQGNGARPVAVTALLLVLLGALLLAVFTACHPVRAPQPTALAILRDLPATYHAPFLVRHSCPWPKLCMQVCILPTSCHSHGLGNSGCPNGTLCLTLQAWVDHLEGRLPLGAALAYWGRQPLASLGTGLAAARSALAAEQVRHALHVGHAAGHAALMVSSWQAAHACCRESIRWEGPIENRQGGLGTVCCAPAQCVGSFINL